MKKTLLIITIVLLGLTVKAQTIADSTQQAQLASMADGVELYIDSLMRPVVVVDSNLNYFFTQGDYVLQATRMVILAYDSTGHNGLRLELQSGNLPKPKVKAKPIKTDYSLPITLPNKKIIIKNKNK